MRECDRRRLLTSCISGSGWSRFPITRGDMQMFAEVPFSPARTLALTESEQTNYWVVTKCGRHGDKCDIPQCVCIRSSCICSGSVVKRTLTQRSMAKCGNDADCSVFPSSRGVPPLCRIPIRRGGGLNSAYHYRRFPRKCSSRAVGAQMN